MQAEDNASKGKLRLSVEEYKAALAMDPNHTAHNVHLHLGLCKVYVKLGRGKDALTTCTDVLDIDEDQIEALVQVPIFCSSTYFPENKGSIRGEAFVRSSFLVLTLCKNLPEG